MFIYTNNQDFLENTTYTKNIRDNTLKQWVYGGCNVKTYLEEFVISVIPLTQN